MELVAGLFIALIAVFLVLEPLLRAASGRAVAAPQPLFSDSDDEVDPSVARRDRALAALKEIDFDKATGKLSDEDYEGMKERFTAEALAALRAADDAAVQAEAVAAGGSAADGAVSAETSDAVEALIASARSKGKGAGRKFCLECGAPLGGKGKFCMECGTPAAV